MAAAAGPPRLDAAGQLSIYTHRILGYNGSRRILSKERMWPAVQTEEKRQQIPNSIGRAVFVALSFLLQVCWIMGFALYLTKYYALIQLASSLIALLVVFSVYGRNMNAAFRLTWIIVILLFPVLGTCLYLLFGTPLAVTSLRRRFRTADALLAPTLQRERRSGPLSEELDRMAPVLPGQARYLWDRAGFPVYRNTRVEFYGDTVQALEAQRQALAGARHFIFMEYHAIEDSTAWQSLEDILTERAAAGVDVRVFYDDVGSMGFISPPFAQRLNAKGIQCRVFNPLIPSMNIIMNNRDHRKITVVDGRIGFTGGYNLADEYFNLTHPYGRWKDSGLRLEGEAVRGLTLIFLQMWGATQRTPLEIEPYLPPVAPIDAQGVVIPYADTPLDDEPVGENVYINLINGAQKYLYLTTPYLIISDEMQRALVLAAHRGVDVRIVTPGIPDKKLIFRVTRSHYARLAAQGVRIYEFTPGFLHAKQAVADGVAAVVGTINLDYRSLYLHFENACWFAGCPAVEDVARDFADLFAQSTEVTGQYRDRTVALRGVDCLLRLFSPLM